MKRGTLFLLTFILLVPIVTGQPYIWEKTGFSETMIQSTMGRLIAHPTDPGTLFLATVNMPDLLSGTLDPADGLWKTTDFGVTWSTTNDAVLLTSYNIMDVAVCAGQPDVIYVGTIQEGIFKSVDGGATWSNVNAGFSYSGSGFPDSRWAVAAVAVDPTNPDKVYISVAQVGGLDIFNLAPSHPGFFYSHDGGVTWTENNGGLPARYDSLLDGRSDTAVAGRIVVVPQSPNYVILGMTDLSVNTSLLFNKKAETDGRIFFNSASAVGSFSEISGGLPQGISQSPEIGGSLVRVSSSAMMLNSATGPQVSIWSSHVSFTFDVSLSQTLMVTRNKGLFFTNNGMWQERNSGLPYISYWIDPSSDPDNTIRFEDTYNMGTVAVGTGGFNRICMVGSNRCDMGDPLSNNTKVYATTSAGQPSWLKDWDQGLDSSPTFGYSEANASIIAFNSDMSYAFATVRWTDDTITNPLSGDNGVYRVKIN